MSRFAEPPDAGFRRLNDSIRLRLAAEPVRTSISRLPTRRCSPHRGSSRADGAELQRGLEQVRRELADGSFPFADGDEDIHMAIERRLTEIVGRVGGRLHTARSRNDQVATDVSDVRAGRMPTTRWIGSPAWAERWPIRPSAISTGRCPATPTCSAPSRSTSATTCSPTCGCCCETGSASRRW